MSLPNGGVFDICADWGGDRIQRKGHFYHRVGASLDIDTRARVKGTNNYVNLLADTLSNGELYVDLLTKIMQKNNGKRYDEASIHYGFNGN